MINIAKIRKITQSIRVSDSEDIITMGGYFGEAWGQHLSVADVVHMLLVDYFKEHPLEEPKIKAWKARKEAK